MQTRNLQCSSLLCVGSCYLYRYTGALTEDHPCHMLLANRTLDRIHEDRFLQVYGRAGKGMKFLC